MATSMNGIVKPNRNRQWVWSMMMPDRVGPSAGGDGKHHGNHAHGCAAFLRRVNRHNAVEQQRDEKRGLYRLHHAPRNQQRKHGRKRANQRAQQEGSLREQQHFFGVQPLNQVGGDGGERAHDQQKARGQPLHGGFVHAEILHDGRERDIEQRIVQIAEKRADKQGGDNGFGGELRVIGEIFVLRADRFGVRIIHNLMLIKTTIYKVQAAFGNGLKAACTFNLGADVD